jgi:hypothetical protein
MAPKKGKRIDALDLGVYEGDSFMREMYSIESVQGYSLSELRQHGIILGQFDTVSPDLLRDYEFNRDNGYFRLH